MIPKRWNVKKITDTAKELAGKHDLLPLIVQLLLNRNVCERDFEFFLDAGTEYLHSPGLLPDMDKAVTRIKQSIRKNEKVLVFGDYDVDGITSLAVFNEFAKDYFGVFSYHIPHRVNEGYGLNKAAIEKASQDGAKLIIAFDCGTNSVEEIQLANSLGLDVVVVDHHHTNVEFDLPYAFVNPKKIGSQYPFKELSAAALAFKLIQALTDKPCLEALDLVALSLVCDVVPLRGENRILLKEGLKRLRKSSRQSIKLLCQASGLKQENLDVFHIAFVLGPRINACGRMANAADALEMFLSDDKQKVSLIASQLQDYNKQRRNIELDILKEADGLVQQSFSADQAIVVGQDGWHPGVLGIVASRLADKYWRPAFVISFDDQVGKGSGRSVAGVHLMDILDGCSMHLGSYGGHKKAAGIHIRRDQLEIFRQKVNEFIKEKVDPADKIPVLDIDGVVDFSDINMDLVDELERLKPFGEENTKPLFASFKVTKKGQPQKNKAGYSLWLTAGGVTVEAAFYDKDMFDIFSFGETFDIAGNIEKNNYYNSPRISLKDVRIAD